MLSKDDKQNVAKIKKLIRTRDFYKIEMGIELVRADELNKKKWLGKSITNLITFLKQIHI